MLIAPTLENEAERLRILAEMNILDSPPDANLDAVLKGTGFELGGYINTRLLSSWSITYAIGSGKVYIKLPA